ncbi:MAG: alpha/beta hydrolase [Bacteroides sp.]|nr:alpha/beta hydrolase [Eubacterium sp.]MCM1417229.1 alpha/beta hydrolase [Roseburia sp.]MCM1461150.1 alpha/beta hydrolase [Bacteroides sp.]
MKHRTVKTIVRSLILSVLIYLILSFLVVMLLYEGLFSRKEAYEQSVYLTFEDIEPPDREVTFDSDGFTLYGRIYHEEGDAGIVILAHGKDGSCEDLLPEARYFIENGYTAMLFDLTGHGKSDGATQRGLCRAVSDMESAVRFCEQDERLCDKPIYLYGFGVGGYGAAMCASLDTVKAVVTVSAFESVQKMTLECALSEMGILGYLEYPVMLLYQALLFGDDIYKSAASSIDQGDTPVLAIHGVSDETVSFSGASLSAAAERIANESFQVLSVEGGKHRSLLYSESAVAYLEEYNEAAYTLYLEYNGNVSSAAAKALYEQYDRERMSELNDGIMKKILEFYQSA